jgi:hypothetical protein
LPQFWPHQTHLKEIDEQKSHKILYWLFTNYGSQSYQGWDYVRDGKNIVVYFSSQEQKIEFELTWQEY